MRCDWPKPALFPGDQTVAVGTKKAQISFVGLPVCKSSVPGILSVFCSFLFRRINVVNIKSAKIAKAADRTFAAEVFNQRKFSFPVSGPFMYAMPILIPIRRAALIAAKAVSAFQTTLLAFARRFPSVRKVAISGTVFPITFTHKIWRNLLGCLAQGTFNFHALSITQRLAPKYFDIACERIENAYRQGKLFEESA